MKQVKLSKDLLVFCENKSTAKLLFSQIGDYFKHGISLEKGDVVFDVGANIGIFSLWVHSQLQGDVNLYAFEPIPNTYHVLEKNINNILHNKKKVKIFNYAILDKNSSVDFTYYRNSSAFSSALPYDNKDKSMFLEMANSSFKNGNIFAKIFSLLPSPIKNSLIQKEIDKMLDPDIVACSTKTLSQVIKEENVNTIDLLKIDVEKTEMDVLHGIDKLDWGKIKKIVIEVHDYDNRLNTIKDVLESYDYSITIDQEEMFTGSNIYSIFAVKAGS